MLKILGNVHFVSNKVDGYFFPVKYGLRGKREKGKRKKKKNNSSESKKSFF